MTSLSRIDLPAQLKKFYLFEKIDENILEGLYAEVTHKVLSSGETLFQQGTPSDALYFVIKGHLKATSKQEDSSQTLLGEISVGEIVGEMQILVGGKRTAEVSAVSETELVRLPKAAFERLAEQYPDILLKTPENLESV